MLKTKVIIFCIILAQHITSLTVVRILSCHFLKEVLKFWVLARHIKPSSSGSYTVSGNVTDNSIFKLSTSIGGSVVDGTGDSTGWTAKAYSIIGANWSFDYTGGTAEDLWTTSAAHGLSVGDKIQFVRSGGGATGYSIDTDYYVVAVPSSTTVQLSTSTGGSVLEGSSDSSGFWYAVDVSDKNEFKMALTYLLM